MNHDNYNHYLVMFCIMIISGLLSTMNMWVDKYDDVRFNINDIYMTLLMSGWMFLFMGLYYKELTIACIGLFIVIIIIWCIRTQFMLNTTQYVLGMIPHHSMAIHISKKLLETPLQQNINDFVKNIITVQEKEIEYMKRI